MHPLDSSLDASVHGHGPAGGRRVVRRRSSIDNGLFGAANHKEVMISRMRSGSSSDGSCGNDGFFSFHDEYAAPRGGQRRLSLNLNTPTTATFLASTTVTSTGNANKCDLDKDCHLWSNEDYAQSNFGSGKHPYRTTVCSGGAVGGAASLHSHLSTSSSRHSHGVADGETRVNNISNSNSNSKKDDDDSTVSFDGSDEDSFCEATGTEPANQEYMMQDLGASCFWNDVDLYPELLHRRRLPPGRTVSDDNDDDTVPPNQGDDSHSRMMLSKVQDMQNMSTDELDYEPNIGNTDQVVSYHTSTTDEVVDDSEDDDDDDDNDEALLYFAEDEMQFLQEELLSTEQDGEHHIHHEEATDDGCDVYHDDFSSECDSFCDADEMERANAEYLTTDLGASCCWVSTDDLLIEMADRHHNCGGHGSGSAIETISEEN